MKCIHADSSPINITTGKLRRCVIPEDRSKDAWIAGSVEAGVGNTRTHRHVSDPGEGVKGEDLSRKQLTTLNRLRTGGVGIERP